MHDSRLAAKTRGLISSAAVGLILLLALPAHGAESTRAPGQRRNPDPDVRRTVVGPGRSEPAPVSTEPTALVALRQAEQVLFGGHVAERCDEICPQLRERGRATIFPSGLPPSPMSLERSSDLQARPVSAAPLRMPDFPVRLSDRARTYLDFYRSDPTGHEAAATWYRASGRHGPMVRSILREYGLPEDLMWVAVVESRFDASARSPVGAAGLWQFMPHTARAYGLVIDRWVDERLDPVRSTHAAAMLLSDLHTRFGSWELALAAYNFGYAGVLAAIRKFNTNDFRVLSRYESGLPWETTLYVPKIVSLAIVGNNPDAFGLENVDKDASETYDEVDVVPAQALSTIAAASRIETGVVQALNPQYLASRTPPYDPPGAKAWRVRLPVESSLSGRAGLLATPGRTPRTHAVQHGESLDELARKHGVFRRDVANLNALRPNETLQPGTQLLLPRRASSDSRIRQDELVVILPLPLRAPQGHERVFYRVVDGDLIEDVARGLSVHVDELRGWNALDVSSRLHGGMTLVALVPSDRHRDSPALPEEQVQVIVAGTDAFHEHVERARGRVRGTIVVRAGDTWRTIAIRTGMTAFQLARINERSRKDKLRAGDKLIAYVSADKAWMVRSSRAAATSRQAPEPPHPADLPPGSPE